MYIILFAGNKRACLYWISEKRRYNLLFVNAIITNVTIHARECRVSVGLRITNYHKYRDDNVCPRPWLERLTSLIDEKAATIAFIRGVSAQSNSSKACIYVGRWTRTWITRKSGLAWMTAYSVCLNSTTRPRTRGTRSRTVDRKEASRNRIRRLSVRFFTTIACSFRRVYQRSR